VLSACLPNNNASFLSILKDDDAAG